MLSVVPQHGGLRLLQRPRRRRGQRQLGWAVKGELECVIGQLKINHGGARFHLSIYRSVDRSVHPTHKYTHADWLPG